MITDDPKIKKKVVFSKESHYMKRIIFSDLLIIVKRINYFCLTWTLHETVLSLLQAIILSFFFKRK